MMKFPRIFYILVGVAMLSPAASYGQDHVAYCEDVESTSEVMKCVKRHYDDAQIRLNMVYSDLTRMLDNSAEVSGLIDSQNAWLTYRDMHCVWESGRAKEPALTRIYELSCITTLTEKRAENLSMSLFRETQQRPREFGTFPRWMNVLAHEYDDVFWRYGDRLSMDLDCDQEEEKIVSGVRFTMGANGLLKGIETVVAISENPPTGKPRIKLFSFPVRAVNETPEDERAFCEARLDLVAISPETDRTENRKDVRCSSAVYLSDEKCYNALVGWNGEEYNLRCQGGDKACLAD